MKTIIKNIPTTFVVLDNGKEVNLNHLLRTIEEFIEVGLDDMGEYGMRNYEVPYLDVADELVNLGYLKIVRGSRMATIYAVVDKWKLSLFYGDLQELQN